MDPDASTRALREPRFGDAEQVALNGALSAGFGRLGYESGNSSSTSFGVEPAFDYFAVPGFSQGATAFFRYLNTEAGNGIKLRKSFFCAFAPCVRALRRAHLDLDRQLLRATRSEFDTPPSTGRLARAGWGGTSAAQAALRATHTDRLASPPAPGRLRHADHGRPRQRRQRHDGGGPVRRQRLPVAGVGGEPGSRAPTPVGRAGGCRWHLSAAWASAGRAGPPGVARRSCGRRCWSRSRRRRSRPASRCAATCRTCCRPQTQSVRDLRALEGRAQVFGTIIVAIESDDAGRRGAAARVVRDRLAALPAGTLLGVAADSAARDRFVVGPPPSAGADRGPDRGSGRAGAAQGAPEPAVRRAGR